MSTPGTDLTAILQAVQNSVQDAENVGYTRGYAQAEADFYGQNAAFLLGNIFADSFEAAASRIGTHDAKFAGALHTLAAQLRAAVSPPSVSNHSPSTGATGVAHDSPVSIVFNEDMDPSTINETNVHVAPASGGAALQATVAFDAKSRTATLTPHNGWSADVAYTVTVETAVHSAAGVGMQQVCTFGFTAAP